MGAKQGNTSNIFDRSLLSVPVPGLIFFITKFKEAQDIGLQNIALLKYALGQISSTLKIINVYFSKDNDKNNNNDVYLEWIEQRFVVIQ